MAVDFKRELVWIQVSDVDQAKRFYLEQAAFDLLVDIPNGMPGQRIVQVTPPGSACSIGFGSGFDPAKPGSRPGLFVVDDVVGHHTGSRSDVALGEVTSEEVLMQGSANSGEAWGTVHGREARASARRQRSRRLVLITTQRPAHYECVGPGLDLPPFRPGVTQVRK